MPTKSTPPKSTPPKSTPPKSTPPKSTPPSHTPKSINETGTGIKSNYNNGKSTGGTGARSKS